VKHVPKGVKALALELFQSDIVSGRMGEKVTER